MEFMGIITACGWLLAGLIALAAVVIAFHFARYVARLLLAYVQLLRLMLLIKSRKHWQAAKLGDWWRMVRIAAHRRQPLGARVFNPTSEVAIPFSPLRPITWDFKGRGGPRGDNMTAPEGWTPTPRKARRAAKAVARKVKPHQTLEALRRVEVERGYKAGWAERKFAASKQKAAG